jgi:DNA-3-methyladenine glycosylase I
VSLIVGDDGLARCGWGAGSSDYRAYHDTEWGKPIHGDRALFERLTLEAFQSGLSWITILRKRENFRAAFADFDIAAVAEFDDDDAQRLMLDAGIVRNRAKIAATLTNARALATWQEAEGEGVLDQLVWSYVQPGRERPREMADLASQSPESKDLSKQLKKRGFVFIGPTTMHAAMQAIGVIDDHLAGCWVVS